MKLSHLNSIFIEEFMLIENNSYLENRKMQNVLT